MEWVRFLQLEGEPYKVPRLPMPAAMKALQGHFIVYLGIGFPSIARIACGEVSYHER